MESDLALDEPIVVVAEAPSASLQTPTRAPRSHADPLPPLLDVDDDDAIALSGMANVVRRRQARSRSIPVGRRLQLPAASAKPLIALVYKGMCYGFDPTGAGCNQLPIHWSGPRADEEDFETAETARA